MKTFVRLIRRYVLAAVGIVLLLLFSGVAVLGWLGWQESCRLPQRLLWLREQSGCTYPASAGEAGSRTRCAAVSADGAGHWL